MIKFTVTQKLYNRIYSFTLLPNKCYLLVENNNVVNKIIEANNGTVIYESDRLFCMHLGNNNIWGIEANQSVLIDTLENKVVEKYKNLFHINSIFISENFILMMKKQGSNNVFCLFDFRKNEILWEIEHFSTIFLNSSNQIFFVDFGENLEKKDILCFDFFSNEKKWQLDISNLGKYIPSFKEEEELGEVKKFIGVYKNQLIVLLTGGKFISLDIENGNLNWETNEVTDNLTNQVIDYGFSDPYHPFLDEEKGVVYMLQGEVLISLNLNTQKSLYEWHIKDEANEEYLFIRQSRMYKNQIYFTAWRKGNEGNDDTIGVFDIDTKKIIWKYTFDFEKGNFIPNSQDNIQVNDSQLFVLDWKGTLHIFERES